MNFRSMVFILFLIGCSTAPQKKILNQVEQTPENCYLTTDDLTDVANTTGHQFLSNRFYNVIYDNAHVQPFIVEYKLKYSKTSHNLNRGTDYPDHFVQDRRVSSSAGNNDYLRTGWDKGHLAPAEDFSFSFESARETFLYSNISPQDSSFNRHGSWSKLEKKARETGSGQEIQVLTGPLKFNNTRMPSSVSAPYVPKYFFKIIISNINDDCLRSLFILKNDSSSNDYCTDNLPEKVALLPKKLKQIIGQSTMDHKICNR